MFRYRFLSITLVSKSIPTHLAQNGASAGNPYLCNHGCHSHLNNDTIKNFSLLVQTKLKASNKLSASMFLFSKGYPLLFYSSHSNYATLRSVGRRKYKKSKTVSKPTLNEAQFHQSVSQLPPRFTPEDLSNVITLQEDPLVCLELFNWASHQPRFRHEVSTYHITIKKLGSAKLYQEMDDVVNQVLAISDIGSEALFNTMIYFFTEARKLSRAVSIYKHMRKSRDLGCRPSIITYNLLFTALLGRGKNSYINHVYMDTIRSLFRQMVNDGIEPDIFSLNAMIKGYVNSLHVNDALRIFHQMGTVYKFIPNSHSYDYLIHGLCAQGRTINAKELYSEMKNKGFTPSSKAYNSLVNCLAIGGEVEEAVRIVWEMVERQKSADFITYRTILVEICRQGRVAEAMRLLKEWQEKDIMDGYTYRKLLHGLEDEFENRND
ncbi:pentatricopeptide repeat-containing protein At2g27800, mitochondrial-like [Telopea speciosissima]|uniref:pentatricopeptide repeat-containing protein At2g27800, mitochondrial-like n=1 Tax=Telopea speciosissima TaxID=54955 RepID=UPI001CC432BD|nr:pentatricopeptide repeat-containing protein At2g27800, mitochondrial-like [Telopea speciosissima]